MRHIAAPLVVVALVGIALGGVWADTITVNGSDSDWVNIWTTADDPNGDVDLAAYDIDYTHYIWDEVNARSAFLVQTVAQGMNSQPQYAGDFIEFLINVDDDTSTGGFWHDMQGADYRIVWTLDGAANTAYDPTSGGGNAVYLQQWTGAPDWQTVAGVGANDLKVAWGNMGGSPNYSVIECALNPVYIGTPSKFLWGAYLDNGTTSADDASPNDMRQRGYTPEPTTMVLLPLGLAGLAAWRRRRAAA